MKPPVMYPYYQISESWINNSKRKIAVVENLYIAIESHKYLIKLASFQFCVNTIKKHGNSCFLGHAVHLFYFYRAIERRVII